MLMRACQFDSAWRSIRCGVPAHYHLLPTSSLWLVLPACVLLLHWFCCDMTTARTGCAARHGRATRGRCTRSTCRRLLLRVFYCAIAGGPPHLFPTYLLAGQEGKPYHGILLHFMTTLLTIYPVALLLHFCLQLHTVQNFYSITSNTICAALSSLATYDTYCYPLTSSFSSFPSLASVCWPGV